MRFQAMLASAMALALAGCSGMMPFVPSPRLDRSFAQPEPIAPAASQRPLFAGDIEAALRDVDAQRAAYYEALRTRTYFREGMSGALIGLTAWGIYRGLNATTDGGQRAVSRLGLAAGGAYTIGNYADSPQTEDAYVLAVQRLTCLALRTRPWLVQYDEYDVFVQTDMRGLEDAINDLDAALQRAHAGGARREALRYHDRALYTARTTLRHASHFRGYVETAGFQLRQEAAMVVAGTNETIRHAQPRLLNPDGLIGSLSKTNQAFRNIKPEPVESEPATDGGGSDSGSGAKNQPSPSPADTGLGQEADKLAKAVEALERRVARGEGERKHEVAALRAELARLRKLIDSKAGQAGASEGSKDPLAELPGLTAAVFRAMRPVTLVLTRAYSLKPYVNAIPECRANGLEPLQFTIDADEVKLAAGGTLEVGLVGGIGYPRVWLGQSYKSKSGKTPELTTYLEGGMPRSVLKLPEDLPAGTLVIHAVDGSGRQADELKVVVEAAKASP